MSFTLRKLQSLPPATRLRKAVVLLERMELELRRGAAIDRGFLEGLRQLLEAEEKLPPDRRRRIAELGVALRAAPSPLRQVNALRHLVRAHLGSEPAEWDLLLQESSTLDLRRLDAAARTVFDVRVFLDDLRSPFNVGAVFRTAESFGVSEILLSPDTPSPEHPRAEKTARGTTRSVPWRRAAVGELAGEAQLFALETGGTDVSSFAFPPRGTVVVGSEELGVSPEALGLADARLGRVSIPRAGAKGSLNVSVAFGIMMERWFEALRSPRGAPR